MANINNVINVALLPEGLLAARDNMNVVAIMTSQQDGPLSSANRYELYSDAASVAAASIISRACASGTQRAAERLTPSLTTTLLNLDCILPQQKEIDFY